jgi:hypothetical protein
MMPPMTITDAIIQHPTSDANQHSIKYFVGEDRGHSAKRDSIPTALYYHHTFDRAVVSTKTQNGSEKKDRFIDIYSTTAAVVLGWMDP